MGWAEQDADSCMKHAVMSKLHKKSQIDVLVLPTMRMCDLVPIWFQKYVPTLLGHVTTLDAMSCCPPISLRLNRMNVEAPHSYHSSIHYLASISLITYAHWTLVI